MVGRPMWWVFLCTCSTHCAYWIIRPCLLSTDVTWWTFDMTILLKSQIANSFCRPLSQITVCTIFSLLKPSPSSYFVRGNIHTCFPMFNIRTLKTLISIVVYLNMYNPLIVILFFISSYCTFYALCFIFFCILCISLLFHIVTVCDCHTE